MQLQLIKNGRVIASINGNFAIKNLLALTRRGYSVQYLDRQGLV